MPVTAPESAAVQAVFRDFRWRAKIRDPNTARGKLMLARHSAAHLAIRLRPTAARTDTVAPMNRPLLGLHLQKS
jgi:hypothetical protein